MNYTTFIKTIGTSMCALLVGFYGPLLPYIGICVLLVLIDFVTAFNLGRRLRRRGLPADGRLSSHKFRGVLATLVRIFVAFTVAALMQEYILGAYIEHFDAVRTLAGAICFHQLMSILENESCATDSTWARRARKYLADKAPRHLQ
ncbi:MAG: hypothetical protein HDT09_00135 [Bacteroidales bacterium]|nr:hypothetical protein [Bacteroidales bacterium]